MPDLRRQSRRLSEDEILQAATITDEDVQRARSWWKTHAPTKLRPLIDADVVVKNAD